METRPEISSRLKADFRHSARDFESRATPPALSR
jgi:hypothetical protein